MRRLILLAIALVAIAVVAGSRLHGGDAQAVAVVEDTPVPTHTPEPHVLVDVTGAVAHPGVYRLTAGSRVVDALLAAGGMTGEADLDALNKAAPIHDGQRIYVPRPGETIPAGSGGSDAQLKIDVNHATALVGSAGARPRSSLRSPVRRRSSDLCRGSTSVTRVRSMGCGRLLPHPSGT